MNERLYYNEPYTRQFDATVVDVSARGERLAVTLDRTAFYPTSGGQPFDTGRLGPFRVVDVIDDDNGVIEHLLESAQTEVGPRSDRGQTSGLTAGMTVRGEIDWERRFDHMQQHTGQHVLSAAFDKLFRVRTVSFHLGALTSTIDLAREVTPAEIAAAEEQANRIVWEDRPVAIRYASAEEAAALPLRKESLRGGTLRLIEVEDFDLSACGGTHVARTGAIGIIAVGSWERFKGGQRIEFLCGGRALARFRSLRGAVDGSVRLLSVLPEELPASIERLQADAKEQKRTITALQTDLARYRADEIAASAELIGDVNTVFRRIDGDAGVLKTLATAIVTRPRHFVTLTSTSQPALVVVARSADVSAPANEILAAIVKQFGGRGGGKPELAQGGAVDAGAQQILAAAREEFVRRAEP